MRISFEYWSEDIKSKNSDFTLQQNLCLGNNLQAYQTNKTLGNTPMEVGRSNYFLLSISLFPLGYW